MDKLCQKPTLFEKLKPTSQDFRDEKTNLQADLASAEKITLTIRGEKIKNKF